MIFCSWSLFYDRGPVTQDYYELEFWPVLLDYFVFEFIVGIWIN